jgi:predicted ATPase
VLDQLCRQPGSESVIETLRQVAPLWLSQLPALMRPEERAALQREVAGAPPARMLREMSEALEALAAERPLVLVLEDLHWADRSSFELLASVARRPAVHRTSARVPVARRGRRVSDEPPSGVADGHRAAGAPQDRRQRALHGEHRGPSRGV